MDSLVIRRVSLKGSNKSLVTIKTTKTIKISILLDVIDISPASRNSLLEVLERLLELVAKESLNTSKVVERGDTMERAKACLLLQELSSLLKTLTGLSLHRLHRFLVKAEPLLSSLPRVSDILRLGAINMEIERTLGALVRSTLASKLATIANEVTVAIRGRSKDELMSMAFITTRLRKLAEIYGLGRSLLLIE
jgi:hypothetical protein